MRLPDLTFQMKHIPVSGNRPSQALGKRASGFFFDHLVLVVSSALFVVFFLHCACAGYHRARWEGLAARPGAPCTWPNTASAQQLSTETEHSYRDRLDGVGGYHSVRPVGTNGRLI